MTVTVTFGLYRADVSNANQADGDGDGDGDVCDNCVSVSNSNQADGDGDQVGERATTVRASAT